MRKTLEERIKFLKKYIKDRCENKFTNKGNDDTYFWNHCGLHDYYKGKLSVLEELRKEEKRFTIRRRIPKNSI